MSKLNPMTDKDKEKIEELCKKHHIDSAGVVDLDVRDALAEAISYGAERGWKEALKAIFSGDTVELDGKFYKISNKDAYNFISSHEN